MAKVSVAGGRPGPPGAAGGDRRWARRRPEVGAGVDAVDLIRAGKVDLVVNTPRGRGPRADGAYIRRAANQHRVACLTTVAAARAAAAGIAERAASPPPVRSLQEYHAPEQLPLHDDAPARLRRPGGGRRPDWAPAGTVRRPGRPADRSVT